MGSRTASAPPGGTAAAPDTERPGVILVAHGSAKSGASAEPVLELARALRPGFPEVRTAFWKEEPFLHQALDTVRAASVIVLPVFLAEGYFTRTVVPRELGLRPGPNRVGARPVHLLPPLGTSPALAALVADRARAAAPPGANLADALLVVLGHGTPRHPGSADAVLAACARLAAQGRFARVAPAFIDQEPGIADALAGAREPLVLLVPFLVAAGWHGGTTVPRDLEREGAASGRAVIYAEPVGTHPGIVDAAASLLLEAERTLEPGSRVSSPLALMEAALVDRLAGRGAVVLLQVAIRPDGSAFELRHVEDGGRPTAALKAVAGTEALELRARRTDDGRHRPLRTAADLPRGWRFRAEGPRALVEALIALYGPALAHWHRAETDRVEVASFRARAAGQSGMYARLAGVERGTVEDAVEGVCDGLPCLRDRLWPIDATAVPPVRGGAEGSPERLPVSCPTPCPMLLTAVLERAGGADPDAQANVGVDDLGARG